MIPWSPVARGALAKPRSGTSLRAETDPFLKMLVTNQQRDSEKEIIDRVEALAKKKGVSMAQVATAWILSKDGTQPFCICSTLVVSAPIVGLNSIERIKEMVEAVNIELTEEEIKHLEEPYVTRSIAGHT